MQRHVNALLLARWFATTGGEALKTRVGNFFGCPPTLGSRSTICSRNSRTGRWCALCSIRGSACGARRALPETQRARFDAVVEDGTTADSLRSASAALATVRDANAALDAATVREGEVAGKTRAERCADFDAKLDAEEALDAAFAVAAEAIAALAGPRADRARRAADRDRRGTG